MRRKDTKSVKRSKITTQPLKAMERPNIVGIKSDIIEHPKTSPKLSKIIRKNENVSQVGSDKTLYSKIKKNENFLNQKNAKTTKRY